MAPRTDVLQMGSRCNNTLAVQHALNCVAASDASAKFGAELVLDGIFGSKTDAAVRHLQKVRRLQFVDGIVGNETAHHLFEVGTRKSVVTLQVASLRGGAPAINQRPAGMAYGDGLPKPPAIPVSRLQQPAALAETAAKLVRDRAVKGFLAVPRMEKLQLNMPELPRFKGGVSLAGLNLAGVATQVFKNVPMVGPVVKVFTEPHAAMRVELGTPNFKSFDAKISMDTAPIVVQPISRPFFRLAAPPVPDTQIRWNDGEAVLSANVSWTPIGFDWVFADLIRVRGGVSAYAGLRGALKLGAPSFGLNAGGRASAEIGLNLFRHEIVVPGNFKFSQIEAVVSGSLGLDTTIMADHRGFDVGALGVAEAGGKLRFRFGR